MHAKDEIKHTENKLDSFNFHVYTKYIDKFIYANE